MSIYECGRIVKTRQSRKFWIVKQNMGRGYVDVNRVYLPHEMIGKRVFIEITSAEPHTQKTKNEYELTEPND